MRNNTLNAPTLVSQSNFRAEDGDRHTTPWNDLCDEVLIPIGSLLAVFVVCALVIGLS